ncbi:MAG: ABC transporter ATP-binding protein [Patescibacteria group bacterium]
MKPVIELTNVTKQYGSVRGVDDVNLRVMKGSVFGFLGPNGAGKTTTISILIDLIRPTSGQASIFGLDCQKDGVAIRRRLGFLAGDFALDARLTGLQQLTYMGNLQGGANIPMINQLAERLSCDLSRVIKTLSRGNRQKVGLISALMNEPELLVFDEPTSGLDPLIQGEFNKIVREYKTAGKTVFISSHALGEVEEICDQVAFIRESKIVAVENMAALSAKSPKQVKLATSDKSLLPALQKLKGVSLSPSSGDKIVCTYSGDINIILNVLSKHHMKHLVIQEADLEAIFMKYYEGKDNV